MNFITLQKKLDEISQKIAKKIGHNEIQLSVSSKGHHTVWVFLKCNKDLPCVYANFDPREGQTFAGAVKSCIDQAINYGAIK